MFTFSQPKLHLFQYQFRKLSETAEAKRKAALDAMKAKMAPATVVAPPAAPAAAAAPSEKTPQVETFAATGGAATKPAAGQVLIVSEAAAALERRIEGIRGQAESSVREGAL